MDNFPGKLVYVIMPTRSTIVNHCELMFFRRAHCGLRPDSKAWTGLLALRAHPLVTGNSQDQTQLLAYRTRLCGHRRGHGIFQELVSGIGGVIEHASGQYSQIQREEHANRDG